MRGASRVNIDTAGGLIVGNLAPDVFVENRNITVVGASINPHGVGIHNSSIMIEGSSDVFANNISVCRLGDHASCGHTSTASSSVFVN